jgi:hypothetical protein
MTFPKWIEPKISIGTIVAVIGLMITATSAVMAYGALTEKVSANDHRLNSIETRVTAKDVSDAALLAQINQDRVSLAGTLAAMATDIRYLRREAEAEKREGLAE